MQTHGTAPYTSKVFGKHFYGAMAVSFLRTAAFKIGHATPLDPGESVRATNKVMVLGGCGQPLAADRACVPCLAADRGCVLAVCVPPAGRCGGQARWCMRVCVGRQ